MTQNENIENLKNNLEDITIKIRTMDKEFEVKIKKSLTIKALKEKIEEVFNIYFKLICLLFIFNLGSKNPNR